MAKGKKANIDESLIIEDYQNGMGMVPICGKYCVGKLRVKKILAEAGLDMKKRGGQDKGGVTDAIKPLKSDNRYPEVEGQHYVAVLRSDNTFVTKDYRNKAGVLTSLIKERFGKETTLWERKRYFKETGMQWWEQWFDIKLVADRETKKCPYCEWTTVDVDNSSGMFETHLRKEHGISKAKHIQDHPEDRKYFLGVSEFKNRQLEDNIDNFVQCKICLRKFTRLGKHLNVSHGITIEEYQNMFDGANITSENFHKAQSERSVISNENSTFKKESKAEVSIREFLTSLGVRCESGNRKILRGKEIDILLPDFNIGIEYDGLLYHNEVTKPKSYHIDKTNEARLKGVSLIHIFEDEYEFHKDIVLAKLKHMLKLDTSLPKIYARKCVVKQIQKHVASDFLDKFHIQGSSSYTVCYGAFCNETLVAVMTFILRKEEWELNRFATDFNFRIIGIGGKLFKHFVADKAPEIVKSFADRRWTTNETSNLYTQIGFSLAEILEPDYSYVLNGHKRIHKFSCRKHTLFSKYKGRYPLSMDMTEDAMADIIGLKKIWDCGLLKYIWTNKNNI